MYYSGERPDDVFVCSPTPWNDLYKTYKWSQITRILKPVRSRILNERKIPLILHSQEFINNSSLKAMYDINITKDLSDKVETSWSIDHKLEVSKEITYGIKMPHNTVLFFQTEWGENVNKSKAYKIGPKNRTQVEVGPHQKIDAKLIAFREGVDVEVTYIAQLDGYIACNYANKHKGEQFLAYKINEVLDAAKIPKEKEFVEVIRINYFSGGKVIVSDVQTMKRMLEIETELIEF